MLDIARPWHQRSQTIPRRLVLRAQLAEATTSRLPTSSTSTKDLQKVRILCGQSQQWLSPEGKELLNIMILCFPAIFTGNQKKPSLGLHTLSVGSLEGPVTILKLSQLNISRCSAGSPFACSNLRRICHLVSSKLDTKRYTVFA